MKRLYSVAISILVLAVNNGVYAAKAYVTNNAVGANSVSIFDTTTNTVTGTVTDLVPSTFNRPTGIAITPNGATAYVVNQGGNSVSVINVSSDTVIQKITGGFNSPFDIAITPDGKKAYVTNVIANSVSVIDLTTNTVSQTITDLNFNGPQDIAITPNGAFAYVTNFTLGANSVSVIDISTNTVIQTITAPSFVRPDIIAITPDGTKAYVTNFNGNSVSIIAIPSNTVTTVSNPNFSSPFFIAISPDGTKAYVGNDGNNSVSVIDVASDSVDTTTPSVLLPNFSFPRDIVFTQDGATAYVVNINNTVSIIDSATNSVTAQGVVTDQTPATFGRPLFIAIVPPVTPSTKSITISGVQQKNIFLTQTDYINIISWTTPTNVTPVSYILYRNAALTDVAGTVTAQGPLRFADHNRNPLLAYTYYLVAVDQGGTKTLLGNVTVAATQKF